MSTGKKVAIEIELLDRISGGLDRINRKMDGMSNSARQARKELDSMDGMTQKLKNSLSQLGLAFSIKEFGQAVVDVRSKIETLQTSFSVLLGDKDKADALFGSIKQFAATTPMMMDDLASGAQTMLGFGIESEKVMEYLKALGDISMGDSQRFQSLTLAFSQMSATGKLMGQDLLQMINAGFNPLKVISEQTGKSIGELKDDMSKGAISAEEVQKAFLAAASSGGQFDGMLEKLSNTQEGALSNLRGAWDDFLNAIGEQTEGAVVTAATGLTDLLHNYEQLGTVLLGIIGTYGTYKAALMLVTAAEGWATAAEAIHYNWLLLVEKAQKLLNATMLNNPYVLLATVAAGLIAAYFSLRDSTNAAEAAQQSLNDTMDALTEQQKKYNEETENAISLAQDDSKATSDRDAAMQTLIQRYPQIIQKYIDEEGHLRNILELKKEIAEFDGKKQRQETTNTLKAQYDNASQNARELKELQDTLKNRPTLTEYQHSVFQRIAEQYKKETGKKWVNLYSIDNMLEYYTQKSTQAGNRYRRNLTENKISDFTGDNGTLGKMTDAQLKALQKKLQDNKTDSKKKTAVFISEIGDYLTYNDRDTLLTQVRGMLDARGQKKSTPAQHKASLKAARDEAKRKLDEFDNSSTGYSDTKYEEERKKLVDALDAAEKKYKAAGGDSVKNETAAANRNAKAQQTAAAKAETERQKEERAEEQRRQAKEKLGQELAELQRRNDAEEIAAMQEGLEKKLRQIDNDYQARKNEIDKQEAEWKRENKKAGLEVGENGLTDEQTQAIAKAREQNDARHVKEEKDARKERADAEAQSLTDYLKEYGSMQERRLAIAREYDEKIAKAGTEGERLSLNAQKARALSDFDIENAKADMNWEDIFGSLEPYTKDQLERIKGQLKDMLSSGDLDTQGYKDVVGQIEKVNDAILEAEDKQRGFLGIAVSYNTERRKLEMDVADAMERQNQAMQEMASASANLTKQRFSTQQLLGGYGISMPQSEIRAANANGILKQVGDKYGMDSEPYKKVRDALDKLAKSESEYNDTVKKKKKADDDATQKQSKLNKYLADFAERLKDLLPLFEQINKNIQDIPGLLSTLGVSEDSSLGKAASAFAEGSNSAMSAMTDYMSGNYVGAAMNAMNAVGSYVQSATNLFAGAGNAKEKEAEIARLSESNKDLAAAIDDLTESIEDSDNTNLQSVDAYKKAVAAEKEREANQQTMMNDRASEYSNSGHGFLGMSGRHSFNKYANDRKGNWLDEFNAALRANGYSGNLKNAQDVWRLSPEEMKVLRDFSPEAWTKFFNSGGESNPKELAEEYIEMAGQLESLTDSLNEKLTGYSWDSFKDSYDSLLKDFTSSTEDFADNIEEVIGNAFLSSLMNDEFKDRIKEIYDYLANAASDGDLTETELEQIRSMNADLAEDILNRRQQLLDAGLIKDTSKESQTGKSGGFTAMTQDQGTKLEGLFTSGLQHLSAMDANIETVADRMSTAESHLARIAENTGVSAAQLKEIKEQIYAIKRDGLKMK